MTAPQEPRQEPRQPQTLDAIALQLTALSHATAALQGQIQGLLVLVQLELRARAGGQPAAMPAAMQASPAEMVTAGNKAGLLSQLERELAAQQRGSGATFMGGRPRPDAAPPVEVPPAPDAPPTTTGGNDGDR